MKKHILFHFGDEIIMERHAKVEGNELVIGTQRYKTVVIPENVFLVCETPEKFKILVNGKEIDKTDRGYFADKSFRKISLDGLLKTGENVVSTQLDFAPNPKVYEDLEKARVFETEKNKLTFDTEIESIYIIGDFAVNTEGEFELLERNAVRYCGEFEVALPRLEFILNKYFINGDSKKGHWRHNP